MLIYLLVIGFISLLIVIFTLIFVTPIYGFSIWYILLMIIFNIILVIIIDAIIAFTVNKLPKKWFNHKLKRFHIFKFERKLYEFLKIRKWKDHIPELGALANFRKNKVVDPNNNEYVEKFLEQCCYGEIVHLVSMFLGFLIIFFKLDYVFYFGIPVAIGNLILNYLPYMVLRYNRPKLEVLYKRNELRGRKFE